MRTKEQIRTIREFLRSLWAESEITSVIGHDDESGTFIPENVQACPACRGKCACCANGVR